MNRIAFALAASLAAACIAAAPAAATAAEAATPQAAIDALLDADRAFSAASAKTDAVTGLSAMFDEALVMPVPGFKFAFGKAAAAEALRANPANAASRARWAPVRGGISADGQHGFTFGYMEVEEAGKPDRPLKYLSYWVKRPEGWRVAAYKRAPRPEGAVSLALLPPALPARIVAPAPDSAGFSQSLAAAERAFSDQAQEIGIGEAFRRNGSADAMNMGPGAAFTLGADAIGQAIAAGNPPSLRWAADGVRVASSGDLGVSWGMIRPNGPAVEGQPSAIPFFTIWRRPDTEARWLYVAE